MVWVYVGGAAVVLVVAWFLLRKKKAEFDDLGIPVDKPVRGKKKGRGLDKKERG